MSQSNIAVFGAGCFWGVQSVFDALGGVLSTRVGYAGGDLHNPTYEQVCTDATGHAEVVEVVFDPHQVSFQKLVEVFFANHNPTQLNRQGPDVGFQYRSVIFYHSDTQQQVAERTKQELDQSGVYPTAIVTAIEPAQQFYAAEEYHQKYFEKRGITPTCHI